MNQNLSLENRVTGGNSEKYKRDHDGTTHSDDFRTPGQLDYDRILYSSAFMRLGGISQVAHAADSTVVHNRLTHSLKVATVGRGLAQRLIRLQPEVAESIGGLDPDVVAAAGLAHDLGHPPFGHVAERVLLAKVRAKTEANDGFEGNAQSFRVVTKLAIRSTEYAGLNLSRATLCAILKYPWMCEERNGKLDKKWGAYETEEPEFKFARQGCNERRKSAEAEIMDFADDITYSTHDIEDYYRAGLIPLDRLLTNEEEQNRFLEHATEGWDSARKEKAQKYFSGLVQSWAGFPQLSKPYAGEHHQRAAARSFASSLIREFFNGITLQKPADEKTPFVTITEQRKIEIGLLKKVVSFYIFPNPGIAAEELGQQAVISFLFDTFWNCQESRDQQRLLTVRHRERLAQIKAKNPRASTAREERCRVVVDVVAEMTEHQAVQTFLRLQGYPSRSLLDLVRR